MTGPTKSSNRVQKNPVLRRSLVGPALQAGLSFGDTMTIDLSPIFEKAFASYCERSTAVRHVAAIKEIRKSMDIPDAARVDLFVACQGFTSWLGIVQAIMRYELDIMIEGEEHHQMKGAFRCRVEGMEIEPNEPQ